MDPKDFFEMLKDKNLTEVEERSGVSRQALYGAMKSQNMKLSNLSSVADSLDLEVQVVPSESEENLLKSLKRFGAPVTHDFGGNLSLESAVALGLKMARKDAYYESVVPYVLALNAELLDANKLLGLALTDDQVNVLGYFCELAYAFKPNQKLKKFLASLNSFKKTETELLVLKEKVNFPELFSKNHLALKWNLLTRGTEQDHLERYKKWQQLRKSSLRSFSEK